MYIYPVCLDIKIVGFSHQTMRYFSYLQSEIGALPSMILLVIDISFTYEEHIEVATEFLNKCALLELTQHQS